MCEAIMILSPNVGGKKDVQTSKLIAPRNIETHLVPPVQMGLNFALVNSQKPNHADRCQRSFWNLLLMLVNHTCNDMDKGFV